MASPRASFRLKQTLIDEVLEVFPGEKSSHSYVEALEYAVRHKRLELSDNVVPPVRQVESKLSDSSKATVFKEVAEPHLSDNPTKPVRQSQSDSPQRDVKDISVRQSEEDDFAREIREKLSQIQELPPLPQQEEDDWEIVEDKGEDW